VLIKIEHKKIVRPLNGRCPKAEWGGRGKEVEGAREREGEREREQESEKGGGRGERDLLRQRMV